MSLMQSGSLLHGNSRIPGVEISPEVKAKIPSILQACRDLGLDFYPTIVEFLTYDEISEIASYGGFPVRYPHWRYGMQYEEMSKGFEHGYHRIYEMVVNCISEDSMIPTNRGTLKAQHLRTGDIVYSSKPRTVAKVEVQNKSKTKKITLCGQINNLICTHNHKWRVLTKDGQQWVEAKDLKSGDLLVGGDTYHDYLNKPSKWQWNDEEVIGQTRSRTKVRLKKVELPQEITLELAELIGVIIGNSAQWTKNNQTAICVNIRKDDVAYQEYVLKLFNTVFNTRPTLVTKNRSCTVVLCSKIAVWFLNYLGLDKDAPKTNRKIPRVIWESSSEYRAAFLRGLFDMSGNNTGLITTESLAGDVQLMLAEMGINTVEKKGHKNTVLLFASALAKNRFASRIGFNIVAKLVKLDSSLDNQDDVYPEFIQNEVIKVAKTCNLPSALSRSIQAMEKVPFGLNALHEFVNRAITSGYYDFLSLIDYFNFPLYTVEHVEDDKERRTIDVALFEEHDFMCNGIISHNTNPCYIYCLNSNTFVDHVTVVAHATGHNDFFKNNIHFSQTSRDMMNGFANHGSRIRRIMSEWGNTNVQRFIDKILTIETLIDPAKAWLKKKPIEKETNKRTREQPRRLKVDHDYMEEWINTKEFRESENERIARNELAKSVGVFEKPEKDIFGWLKTHAPLKSWQQDVISMLYEEAMYFAPQRSTKSINEGHACLASGHSVPTNLGMLPIEEIVKNRLEVEVFDGEVFRKVTDYFIFPGKETIKIKTKKGNTLCGSGTHRVMGEDGDWIRLDELDVHYRLIHNGSIDEVIDFECGKDTVYDLTVEGTHRYVANGFINHNSFVDFKVMAKFGFAEDSGIFDYAMHKAMVLGGKYSTNPYKLGFNLLRWIEEKWDKGRFGWDYEDCQDVREKEKWDTKAGLGWEKVLEVRKFYDDVNLIGEFFDQEFCDKYEFFEWKEFPDGSREIVSRDAKKIKKQLVKARLNGGLPDVRLVESNFRGKGILALEHYFDGRTLHPKETTETLFAVSYLWDGPVVLLTKDRENRDFCWHIEDSGAQVVRTTVDKI